MKLPLSAETQPKLLLFFQNTIIADGKASLASIGTALTIEMLWISNPPNFWSKLLGIASVPRS